MVFMVSITTKKKKINEKTVQAKKKLLDYCATNPDDKIRYNQSNMVLHIHSD